MPRIWLSSGLTLLQGGATVGDTVQPSFNGAPKGGVAVLSKGTNKMGGDHAEMAAARSFARLKWKKKDAAAVDILVVRVDARGKLAMSKPCPMCVRALSGIPHLRYVYYTDALSQIRKVRFRDLV